jgi:hypothetical protein
LIVVAERRRDAGGRDERNQLALDHVHPVVGDLRRRRASARVAFGELVVDGGAGACDLVNHG